MVAQMGPPCLPGLRRNWSAPERDAAIWGLERVGAGP